MFASGHKHYSRWVPGCELAFIKYPAIFTEFCAGKFIVHKTSNKVSAIAIDQCHEQNNAIDKDSA